MKLLISEGGMRGRVSFRRVRDSFRVKLVVVSESFNGRYQGSDL